MERFLLSHFRSTNQLPLSKGINEGTGVRYAASIYFIGALAFVFTFVVYFEVDSLKTLVTSVVDAPIVGQTCRSLAVVNKQLPLPTLVPTLCYLPTLCYQVLNIFKEWAFKVDKHYIK